ncbi:MAG TPA: DUF4382 domain-containing protein [Candidatus Polarisedimenticolaceae bacterium]|nr:DUF4382 domain-containing protein [Candidatus Polarisedimenticolaceae bacterium]
MISRTFVTSLTLGVIVLTLGGVACNDSNDVTGGTSQMRVLLTDAPSDLIASAKVTISRVYLVGNDGGSVDVMPRSEMPLTFELLDLRNGVEALLADHAVPAGRYGQLRLVVEHAEVRLVDGLLFSDGSSTDTLTVPSGMQSGIKVQLSTPLDADADQVTIVVVDFDVDRNFVLQGNAEPPTEIQSISFTPVLQEKRREQTPQ